MLEMLLRLLGLKRRRRRRVYAQPPMPPGAGQPARRSSTMPGTAGNLRREAELQTAEHAHRLMREREAKKAGWLVGLPGIGGWFKPKRRRVESPMPPAPSHAPTPVRRTLDDEHPMRMDAPQRPRRTPRSVLRELGDELARSWTGPGGRVARQAVLGVLVFGVPVLALGVPGYFIVSEMRNIGIEVAPFAVPAATAKTGRTPEVLAQLLIDQIDAARRETVLDRSERWPGDIGGRQPAFDLASDADTLHNVAVWLRGLTPRPVRMISGAVTELPDGKLSLRIYMTGMNRGAPVAALEGFNGEDLNRVIAGAAPLLLRAASPRLYAWYLANHEQRNEALQAGLHLLLTDPASGEVELGTRDAVDFLIARNLARTGRADEALELSSELIKRAPHYPPGYFARALALLGQDDEAEALAAAQEARRIDGGNAWSYKVTARILLNERRMADALTDIRVARRLDPNDGSAIVIEAEALMSMRRIEEAASTVRIELERAPGQPGILEAAAGVMLARGRPDVAIGLVNDELRQRPDRASALIMKARLLSAIGRGPEALEAADAALRVQPTNGMAQTARGYALVTLARPSEGLALFDKLIESAPDNPTVRQGRALALAQLGRKDDAIAEYKHVLDLMPDFGAARRELEKLQSAPPVSATAPPESRAAPKSADGSFAAAPIDVGPAPAPAAPRAESSQLPVAPGMFMDRRNLPRGPFRRPDSETP